ncbi:SusC/RagA family TonB-linked outer membrane protein [Portibacter lacus]|uniref:SusC/RagA family TonB-linked outer membrane protein n=1 Tax=Portibacter lacus TaxID=1099794 RepID=A0AA37SPP6_9BACT|nr:SusC/RagA family TonB-linked outer membrane protein [Portibacter lacus]GLR17695.1 SusC/RagA family TonB-linked outer membrane protein [Portibacter lacus]
MKKSISLKAISLLAYEKKLRTTGRFIITLTAIFCSFFASAQTVTGVVTEASTGDPIIGASIVEKGASGNGTITDLDGKYSINLTTENPVLTFSYVGFTTVDIAYSGQATWDIALEGGALLDEVVVTALGVSREKKALGYATSEIKSSDLNTTQVTNFATAMYGKAPGVTVRSVPGGATSGININIRGFSSITGNTQPLIVMDGIPIRNGETSSAGYWGDQRIRGNGLTDINPDDIESISILKGASAAALYGSDATNGVVLITSKKGSKKRGLGVDFSASYNTDRIAYMPRYQNVRGPGYSNLYSQQGQGDDMFTSVDTDGDGVGDTRGLVGTSLNFGPEFDGEPVVAWTGEVVPYVAGENSYADFFQPATSSNINLAVSQGNENSSIRFSFTRQDNEMISLGSSNDRNIANLSTRFQIGEKFNTTINVKYINQTTTNRPYKVDRMINNFGGMMDRFESPDWYFDRAETSLGYRYRTGTQASLTPDENITGAGFKDAIADYVYRLVALNSVESNNRVIANLTQSWEIIDGLSLRGRLGSDFTAEKVENKNKTQNPSVLYTNPGGGYSLSNSNYSLVYGEALLSYRKDLTQDLGFSVSGGYNAQQDQYLQSSRGTSGGLSPENFFAISGSINTPVGSGSSRYIEVKDAIIGLANLDYKGWAFLEGTIRRDRTSRITAENNAFVYPSVNGSLVLSEAFSLPTSISFAKLRASYGVVGNYPQRYQANVAYNQSSLGVQTDGGQGILYSSIGGGYGNDAIRPEQKQEFEIGLNVDFLTRFTLDASFYDGFIVDQILPVDLPASQGFGSVLTNIGTLRNTGIELALDMDIIRVGDIKWKSRINFAKNTNKVVKLANEATELVHANFDGNAAQIRSVVGRPMGDIYAHPVATDPNGNQIVSPNGLHQLDGDVWEVYGNAMPDFEGGFINNFFFKGISLDIITDFSVGGAIMPTGVYWLTSRGLTEESLNFRNTETGGLSYYIDADGKGVQTTSAAGPNGELVQHNGMLLEGVVVGADDVTGEITYTENTNVIPQTLFYAGTYNWGGPQYGNSRYELYINDNNWWKVREMAVGYTLPKTVSNKLGMQNARVNVYGRNLFFLYRSIKDIDPEQTTSGPRWYNNINNAGNNPAFRSFGIQLTAGF